MLKRSRYFTCLLLAATLSVVPNPGHAGEIRVAVASNFVSVMERIADEFRRSRGHEVILSAGSSGKHFAQIRNGAPFDLFFAADAARPRALEEEGFGIRNSRFTYARGRLVLWSPRQGFVDGEGAILNSKRFRFLAIANPDLAPYGHAAIEVLAALGLWESLRSRVVRGENVGQSMSFIVSGMAQLGFVSYSQVKTLNEASGSMWLVPESLYAPIDQQALLLRDDAAAREFVEFVRSPEIRKTIEEGGYQVPR